MRLTHQLLIEHALQLRRTRSNLEIDPLVISDLIEWNNERGAQIRADEVTTSFKLHFKPLRSRIRRPLMKRKSCEGRGGTFIDDEEPERKHSLVGYFELSREYLSLVDSWVNNLRLGKKAVKRR